MKANDSFFFFTIPNPYPVPPNGALCCSRCDVAGPSLLVQHLHGHVPVAAVVSGAERNDHAHGEVEVSLSPTFDPDHSADQLLCSAHHQAAQSVRHLAGDGLRHARGRSEEASVWHT